MFDIWLEKRTQVVMKSVALFVVCCAGVAGCSRPAAKPVVEIKPSDPAAIESLPPPAPGEGDWPWWRGVSRDNHAIGPLPPVKFSRTENVKWKTPVPGRGHASPIVWGDHVFVATADESSQTQSLLCLDRENGQPRWSTAIHQGGFMRIHNKNSHASATPACDGQRVFTVFLVQDALWVTSVDLDGELQWQESAGAFRTQHGFGASPLLHKSLVIVAGDTSAGGFLTALHRATGEIVWRVRRESSDSYGTPTIANIGGRELLVMSGQQAVAAYNPDTGEQVWRSAGPSEVTANTVATNGELVVASGGYPQRSLMAIRADGSGEVEWQHNVKAYVPSPLIIGDKVLATLDNGIVMSVDLASGRELWKERLGGDITASPTLIDNHVFLPNESGRVFVFRAGDRLERVAENDLGEPCFASPVICGGQLFMRTAEHLYCIAEAEAIEAAAEN